MTATQATDTGARSWLPAELRDWLDAHAQALDEGAEDPASVLPRLGAGVRLGVPASQGGLEGSDAGDAIEAVSQLAEHSWVAAASWPGASASSSNTCCQSGTRRWRATGPARCCAASWPAPRRCPTP